MCESWVNKYLLIFINHPDFQLFKKKYDCTEIEYIYLEEDDIEFDESEELIIIEDFTE